MVYHSFDDWASRVPKAPRCRCCCQPLGLGEFANYNDVINGDEDLYICIECATHLSPSAISWNKITECRLSTRKYLVVPENATCGNCVRAQKSRLYLEAFRYRGVQNE